LRASDQARQRTAAIRRNQISRLRFVIERGINRRIGIGARNMREDGALKRPTVYDPNYAPKLMRDVIADAFRTAPPGRN